MTNRQTKFRRRDVNDAEQTLTLLSLDIRLPLRKGMCLAPTARHSLSAWGAAPGGMAKKASALKARFTSENQFVWNQKKHLGRLQRAFSAWLPAPQLDPGGAAPGSKVRRRLWRKEIEWKALFQRDAETAETEKIVGSAVKLARFRRS